jgi:hypothetical protein
MDPDFAFSNIEVGATVGGTGYDQFTDTYERWIVGEDGTRLPEVIYDPGGQTFAPVAGVAVSTVPVPSDGVAGCVAVDGDGVIMAVSHDCGVGEQAAKAFSEASATTDEFGRTVTHPVSVFNPWVPVGMDPVDAFANLEVGATLDYGWSGERPGDGMFHWHVVGEDGAHLPPVISAPPTTTVAPTTTAPAPAVVRDGELWVANPVTNGEPPAGLRGSSPCGLVDSYDPDGSGTNYWSAVDSSECARRGVPTTTVVK